MMEQTRQLTANHKEAYNYYNQFLINEYINYKEHDKINDKRIKCFLKRHINTRKKYVDLRTYNNVISDIMDKFIDLIIYDSMIIDLPYVGSLGVVGIRKKPKINKNGEVIIFNKKNMIETFKLWKEHPELTRKKYIYYMNEHTNGFYYTLWWFNSIFKNSNFYTLKKSKSFKKKFNDWILNPNRDSDYYKLKDE